MLPIESFLDVVFFLGYYDLGGLNLANRLSFAAAKQCANAIRMFDFPEFAIYVNAAWIDVYGLDLTLDSANPFGLNTWVCRLQLPNEKKLAAFITEAFRNCNVGRFARDTRCKAVLNAIKTVSNTITVEDLHVKHMPTDDVRELFEFIGIFRRVKV